MYRFLKKPNCYRDTYSKPFLARIVFEVVLKGNCKLVADNVCSCDQWFPHDDKLKIKYNIVCDGELKPRGRIIQKSIIIDISSINKEDFNIGLKISNLAGLTDKVNWKFTQLAKDHLIEYRLKA